MKKLTRSRPGWPSSWLAMSIRVRPIEMSMCPASSNTVQRGRSGSGGSSFVGSAHSSSDKPANVSWTPCSSRSSVSSAYSYDPMPTPPMPAAPDRDPTRRA